MKGCYARKEVKTIKEDEFLPWQKKAIDILREEADDRKIYWFYSKAGGVGKTAFAKYCLVHEEGVMIADGSAKDIMNQVDMYMKNTGNPPRAVMFNLCRSVEDHVSYKAMEALKDGIGMNGKYEGGQIVMNPCHVFVLANCYPDATKMSDDRFVITCLDD